MRHSQHRYLLFLGLLLTMPNGTCVPSGEESSAPLPKRVELEKYVESETNNTVSVVDVLRYSRYIAGLKDQKLAYEYMQSQQAFAADHSDINRLRFAILISVPHSPVRDGTAAHKLLADYLAQDIKKDQGMRDLAALVLRHLEEQARQEAHFEALKRELKILQAANHDLQEKLNALTSIEKSINERQDANQLEGQ
jgi:hypothetical protein